MANCYMKKKVLLSFCQRDRSEIDQFIDYYTNSANLFVPYAIGVSGNDDFIDSTNPEYVMSQIRSKYLKDTTVTIVLVGSCTHSRRYVDWELKTSLRRGSFTPNGVMGFLLPSQGDKAYLPPRFEDNLSKDNEDCYARYLPYPSSEDKLAEWVEDAHSARIDRVDLIVNNSEMMKYNVKYVR